jgi:hypothetical protein
MAGRQAKAINARSQVTDVTAELSDDGEVDPVLLAGLSEAQTRSARCQPTVIVSHPTNVLVP